MNSDLHLKDGIKERLLSQRLHLITGKGGVGKSVISISLALFLKKTKKRILLVQMSPVETDPDERSEIFLRIRERLPPLDYIYIEPRSALEEYGIMVLRFKKLYRMVFEDRMVRSSIRAMPSLSFLLLIGKLWYYCTLRDKKGKFVYDYVVVDAPSTGLAISMLNLPHVINDAAPSGPLRDRALDIEKMLTDKDVTSVHIVSTCEETPVNEAIELYNFISDRLSIQFGLLFVNQFEYLPDVDIEYINSNLDKLPEMLKKCVEKKIQESMLKYNEYKRLIANIAEKDRRIVTVPAFEEGFDTLKIVNRITSHMEENLEY